ncbi:MAG TPA: 16S rRNA (guanine(527)-N(7))-methyltransferase RsmG [Bryobacteraceae bacterium]|nr:16S rRNA (guanine(527)-N(7))-methyltransferase RsmG [Bryobacteraceae bacterium]
MFAELLKEKLRGVFELSADQVCALERHYELLVRWNKILNLTSVRNISEAVERHYSESVFLGAHLPSGALNVADIGSGAGFPGVPVAVMRPDCTFTLIESHQRKAVFLREGTRDLRNVRVAAKRAEDVEAGFDWAISRAVNVGDIAPVLSRIASNIALLAGEVPPAAAGLVWADGIRLPWGERRYLWLGQRVSRET